jgi:DUF2075 family protein/predicted GIY-YIG superfamily endonuclease
MTASSAFEIQKFDFNPKLYDEFQNVHYAKNYWPIVYILSDGKINEAYVGETTDAYARMNSHLRNNAKNKLTAVHLITSEKFNKSATLDIESNLIKYISGDGQFKLINGNIGLANHNYYQKKELYWDIFRSVWDKLRSEGIAKHSIEYIDNSDLFKYSPYKSLTNEQKYGLLAIANSLLSDSIRSTIVEGGAGTGKTILAIFLFKLLNSNNEDFNFKEFGEEESEFIRLIAELKRKYPNPSMALVVPMASFRNTLKKVFKNIKGLHPKMVVTPAELTRNKFDIVVVDEAHRLRRRVNLGTYFGAFDIANERLNLDKGRANELDWVVKQSGKSILFYDDRQSIKPSDVEKSDFDRLKSDLQSQIVPLKSQFRVKGGNDYVRYIDKLLNGSLATADGLFGTKEYEFVLFDSIKGMVSEIKQRDKEHGLSRMVAGYSWAWASKDGKATHDIEIDNTLLKWNSVADDWVNSEGSVNEVGCIHTTQGYDLNYTGVIFGNEITYDPVADEIVVRKENYFDKNGKMSIKDPEELKSFIINIYKTLMLRGIKGTYVYACDPQLRAYFSKHILPFKEEKINYILPKEKVIPFNNAVPLYNLEAAAGNFSELQIVGENVEDCEWVQLPQGYRPSRDLFACRIKGESMNKVIPNGSICLFRKYSGGSRNGRIVLVEHTSIQDPDFGSGYTVKEYHSRRHTDGDTWSHESIILKPLSYDSKYTDIEIKEDELASLKVLGLFETVLSA